MATVFAVVNQKGGVGKTTTAINLAAYLAEAGIRTLLVDLDPQGNATSGLGVDKSQMRLSIYDVLVEGASAAAAAVSTPVAGLDIVPATLDLAGAEPELMGRVSRETVLREALQPVRSDYGYVLIDAPPSLGLLTLNALVAADSVLMPIQTEFYALEGISQLLQTVDLVRRRLNSELHVGHVILTMYDNRVRLAQQVMADVRQYFGEKVCSTAVPRNVRLSEAPSHGLPITLYDPRSRGAQAYREIALEILENGKERTR